MEMSSGLIMIAGIIIIIIVINLLFTFRRARNAGKSKGRKYIPPDEAKQAEWRDKEIVRRIEREQDNLYERVKLRNETLALYETVRSRHAYEDTLMSYGIKADDDSIEELKKQGLENYLKYKNVQMGGTGEENLIAEIPVGDIATSDNLFESDAAGDII